jgi:hypothetical protein
METIKTLDPWEEACGTLMAIRNEGTYLVLDFGKFSIRLRSDESATIRNRLESKIGSRIAVLRTDRRIGHWCCASIRIWLRIFSQLSGL